MRIAMNVVPSNLLAWWSQRYKLHHGHEYHSSAKARDEYLLAQWARDSKLPQHQSLLAIDNWLREHDTNIPIFIAAFPDNIELLTDDDDDIAVARVYLLELIALTPKQQMLAERLRRQVDEFNDLSTAWDPCAGDPELLRAPIKQTLTDLERYS